MGKRLSLYYLKYEHFDVISMKVQTMEIVVTLLNICYRNNYLTGIRSGDEINCLNLFVVEKFVNSRADGLAAFSMS